MRVALAAEGTRGDVHPLLDLGTALAAHGHEVLVCAPPDFREDAEARGLPFRGVGLPVRPFLDEHARDLVRGGRHAFAAAAGWMSQAMERQFAELPEAIVGSEVLVGGGVLLAGPSLAEHAGIPYHYLVYCPALLRSAEHPPVVLPVAQLPRILNRLAWAVQNRLLGLLLRRPLELQRRTLGLGPVGDVYAHMHGPQPLIAADALLGPTPADCRVEARTIGCLHAPSSEALPAKLEQFLDDGEPPIYFGFGSMPDPDPATTTGVLLAAIEQLGGRAVIQAGWAGLGDVALPPGVATVGDCSHASLFPRCAAIVHHGGAGTTTAAARAGVPQLVVAHLADQFYWGRRTAELGIAPPALRRSRLSAERLAERLATLRDNDAVCERARDLGQRLCASHPLDEDPARFL